MKRFASAHRGLVVWQPFKPIAVLSLSPCFFFPPSYCFFYPSWLQCLLLLVFLPLPSPMAEFGRATGSKMCKHQNVGQPSVLSYRLETAVCLWAVFSAEAIAEKRYREKLHCLNTLWNSYTPFHFQPLKMMNQGIALPLWFWLGLLNYCPKLANLVSYCNPTGLSACKHNENLLACLVSCCSFPLFIKPPWWLLVSFFFFEPLKIVWHICGSAYCSQIKPLLNCRTCFHSGIIANVQHEVISQGFWRFHQYQHV